MYGHIAIVVLLATVFKANGLCYVPCQWQDKTYRSATDSSVIFEFKSENASFYLQTGGNVNPRECLGKSGPFFMIRRTTDGSYSCFTDTMADPTYNVIVAYITPFRSFPNTADPSFCDVCFGFNTEPSILVLDGRRARITGRRVTLIDNYRRSFEIPRMECNRPKNCPFTREDNPCNGCENVQVNGICCNTRRCTRRNRRHYGYLK